MNKEELIKLRSQYMLKMIPHTLAQKAKKLGVRQTNKLAWRNLVASVKNELDSHFDEITPMEAVTEMSFNNKPINICVPRKENMIDNDKIANRIYGIPQRTKEWIKDTRLDLLERTNQYICGLESMFAKNGVKVYQKMPIVFNGRIYFSDIFLPEYDVAIEIHSNGKKMSRHNKKLAQRISDYFNLHIHVIYLSNNQAKDPKYFENNILRAL